MFAGLAATLALLAGCNSAPKEGVALSGLKRADFQAELQGKKTDLYMLRNEAGMEVCVTNFGARVVSIMVPDKDGKLVDVCVGQPSIQAYSTIESDFGATIGRYANRIAGGKITLDGTTYQLPQNNFGHCLHGGCTLNPSQFPGFKGEYMGWQYKVMDVEEVTPNSITMTFVSPDGEPDLEAAKPYREKFKAALDNDLNTSLAVTALYDALKAKVSPATVLAAVRDFDTVLQLGLLDEAKKLIAEEDEKAKAATADRVYSDDPVIRSIEERIDARTAAKKAKNYAEADRIRAELLAEGIVLTDTAQGTLWSKA